jgi:hypothetical protein
MTTVSGNEKYMNLLKSESISNYLFLRLYFSVSASSFLLLDILLRFRISFSGFCFLVMFLAVEGKGFVLDLARIIIIRHEQRHTVSIAEILFAHRGATE